MNLTHGCFKIIGHGGPPRLPHGYRCDIIELCMPSMRIRNKDMLCSVRFFADAS